LYQQNDKDFLKIASLLFNTFIFAQIFNLVNSRRINDEYNVFEGLHKSTLFLIILAVIIFCQAMIINFLGYFFKVEPLQWNEWLVSIAIGSGAMIWSLIIRAVSRNVSCGVGAGLITAVGNRLAKLNEVKSKHMIAASAAYKPREGLDLTVQEAVSLARGNAAAAAAAEADAKAAEEKGDKKKFWQRKGKAGTREERTLSGRSDSAGSIDRV
jgi:hypothetical protein